MIQLNLLPDIKREYLKARRAQARVISMSILLTFVIAVITVVLALWVYGGQGLYKAWLEGNINAQQEKVKSTPDVEKYVTIQNQLAKLPSLHDGNNDFSRLLDFLPILNPKAPNTVRFNSVEISDDTQLLSIGGEANDFTGLVTLRDIMLNADYTYTTASAPKDEPKKAKLFSETTIVEQQLGKNTGGGSVVSFRITAKYAKEAFTSSSLNVTVTVPRLETTPSKQDSPNLFAPSTATSVEGDQ